MKVMTQLKDVKAASMNMILDITVAQRCRMKMKHHPYMKILKMWKTLSVKLMNRIKSMNIFLLSAQVISLCECRFVYPE